MTNINTEVPTNAQAARDEMSRLQFTISQMKASLVFLDEMHEKIYPSHAVLGGDFDLSLLDGPGPTEDDFHQQAMMRNLRSGVGEVLGPLYAREEYLKFYLSHNK